MNTRDLNLMYEGNHTRLYEVLGCHQVTRGYKFTVYAPNAMSIFVFGAFNNWNKYEFPLKKDAKGFFTITIPIKSEVYYKYIVIGQDGVERIKSDPFAFYSSIRPNTDSIYYDYNKVTVTPLKHALNYASPLNIYEAYLGGFKHHWRQQPLYNYLELTDIVDYIDHLGYTALEIMPITEHPFDGSWGYQPTGFFSPTSRFGHPDDLKALVSYAHKHDILVILDFVLGHFCVDANGLEMFDGTMLYESRFNDLWGVYTFSYDSGYVRSFLKSAIFYFLRIFGFDGIRVDAVSYILYYDGDASKGVNQSAMYFLKSLNASIKKEFGESKIMIAEDSSVFPGVTSNDGLGFDYKWCLGWMHDTLKYFSYDPQYRSQVFHQLTFSFVYMYDEKYILPLSHDEVVHLKKPMLLKMFGDLSQQFSQYRQLLAHMYAHPGKMLNFMGNEFAVKNEFNEMEQLDWPLLSDHQHQKFHHFVQTLNHTYKNYPALFELDVNKAGFEYVYEHVDDNVLAYHRIDSNNNRILVIMNTSGLDYASYAIHLLQDYKYELILDTSDVLFGGHSSLEKTYTTSNKVIYVDLPKFTTLYLYSNHEEDLDA